MLDRQLLGDIGLAILLALPTAAFARPEPPVTNDTAIASPIVEKAAEAERTTPERRTTLPS